MASPMRACTCCSARKASPKRLKTWKASADPHYAVKKARIEHLYAIADREVILEPGEAEIVFAWTSSTR
jgi:hypothetical protein